MTLDKLATRLGVVDRQLRVTDRNTVVCVAGMRGHVRQASHGSDVLNVVLYPAADAMARGQLIDANVITKLHGDPGLYRLQRLPNGAIECEAFAAMIGLVCQRERAS
jgi:hypothetical protein